MIQSNNEQKRVYRRSTGAIESELGKKEKQ